MQEKKHDMKGFLSLLLLWMMRKKPMTGAAIATELEKRKGTKPSPGTIYPALKELKKKGLVTANKKKEYSLTKKGKAALEEGLNLFCSIFSDFEEMKGSCCRK